MIKKVTNADLLQKVFSSNHFGEMKHLNLTMNLAVQAHHNFNTEKVFSDSFPFKALYSKIKN